MGSQGTTALTLDDYLALCEAAPEGVRYEAVGGRAVMMSGATPAHQFAVFELGVRIHAVAPPGLNVLTSPLDWVLWQVPSLTLRQPDLVVVDDAQLEGPRLMTAPVLAVDVLSPTTRAVDLRDKRTEYARAGARHYWVVDLAGPSITAMTLDGSGGYRTVAEAKGDDELTVQEPFPVSVTPAGLAPRGSRP